MVNCKNCNGNLIFSPKYRGNVCESCGSVFPIPYTNNFFKKSFEENIELKKDKLLDNLKNMKCTSCGASVLVNKQQLQAKCSYCGETSIVEERKAKLTYIDSIIPFNFDRADALKIFKENVNKKFFANKKLFKNVKESDIVGSYVNAFIFDLSAVVTYNGVFSYTRTKTDKDGKTTTETIRKHVNGVYDKIFKNITVEANSNLNQHEIESIEPFPYATAVEFKQDFLNGYMLEYQDKVFDECFNIAENRIKTSIRSALLSRHGCDRIESLNMTINYPERKYNYCLLPVYFVNTYNEKKKQSFKAIMNGYTGKVGSLPSSAGKIVLIVLLILIFVFGFTFIPFLFL